MRWYRVSVTACGLLLTACAIHPLIEDLTSDALPDIVMKVRCEAKAAILKHFPDEKDPLRWTSVAFKFEFTMKENNGVSSTGSVKIPISFGSFTMGWDAGLGKERRTIQTFGLGDNFTRLAGLPCENVAPGRNYLYPVTGEVGLMKTFESYGRLVRQNPGAFKGEISEVLRFQTDWKGSLKPSWNLVPLSKQVIGMAADATANRSDVHQVTLEFKPLLTEAQEKKKRKMELDRLAEEKALPTHFVLVDPDNRPIDPRTLFGQGPRPLGEGRTAAPDSSPAAKVTTPKEDEKRLEAARRTAIERAARSAAPSTRAPSSSSSQSDNDRRAYEQLQDNESRRLNQRLLDELRTR